MGRFGTFSFHGTKTITTGEGGMFSTDDDDLCEKVQYLDVVAGLATWRPPVSSPADPR
jgi:dTDP-4-amino-4,6-dideoxygalactose transaminase